MRFDRSDDGEDVDDCEGVYNEDDDGNDTFQRDKELHGVTYNCIDELRIYNLSIS